VVASAIVSALVGSYTARRAVLSDHAKRQSELALKISNMLSDPDDEQRLAAFRRFAVGIVKVVEPVGHVSEGRVFFIPVFSRVTAGRHSMNDICLDGAGSATSRWHCGFIAGRNVVWIDDYMSANGTKVNGRKISRPTQLRDDDVIEIAEFKLVFRAIRENSILLQ
jgi:hypothetical protein